MKLKTLYRSLSLQLGPGHRAQPCELCWLRQSAVQPSDCSCEFVRVERMGSAQHARERVGVGRGLLARELRGSAAGRDGVDERRLRGPHDARRFLEQPRSRGLAFGEPLPQRSRDQVSQHRFSCCEGARLETLCLYLFTSWGAEPPCARVGVIIGWIGAWCPSRRCNRCWGFLLWLVPCGRAVPAVAEVPASRRAADDGARRKPTGWSAAGGRRMRRRRADGPFGRICSRRRSRRNTRFGLMQEGRDVGAGAGEG